MTGQVITNHPDTSPLDIVSDSKQANNFYPFCKTSIQSCEKNEDCKKCAESVHGIEMVCVDINPTKQKIGSNTKVCAPAEAKLECNSNYGGAATWSGWSDAERMEWDCFCNYPEWSETSNCKELNADICPNGSFNWDLNKKQSPEDVKCVCPPGFKLVQSVAKRPLCLAPSVAREYGMDLNPIMEYVGCFLYQGSPTAKTAYPVLYTIPIDATMFISNLSSYFSDPQKLNYVGFQLTADNHVQIILLDAIDNLVQDESKCSTCQKSNIDYKCSTTDSYYAIYKFNYGSV